MILLIAIMENRYVIDTVAFINYFNIFFNEVDILTPETRRKINLCFDRNLDSHKLVIPSIVFLEIFRKFLINEEKVKMFFYEIYNDLRENSNIEIKAIEKEVLEIFQNLNDFNMENNDKLIYASAVQLKSALITNDPVIISYNNKRKLIPSIIF
jgi:PIN domain nuclease of toxin-antitoxin system